MSPQTDAVPPKLLEIRQRKDLKLRATKHLKDTYVDFAGRERPLVIRYYQVQGILHLVVMNRFLLGDDTGLGKTIQAIGALCYIWEKDPNRKVIILTTKSAAKQWASEFTRFTRGVALFVAHGNPAQRAQVRAAFETSTGPTVLVMGYRSAVQDFRHIQNWQDFIFITDEATVYKNPKTQIHQVCRHLSNQANRMWALTATLIKNHLMEGYGIYQIVMPGLFRLKDGRAMTAQQFMLYFCLTRMQPIPRSNRQVPVIVGYLPDKIQEFKQVIDPYFIGRPKHEVATELPALTTRVVEVTLTPFQEDKYTDALAGLLALGDGPSAQVKEVTKLTAISYCQEIVNHPELIGCDGDSPKLDALLEILTEGDLEDDKVIVFTRFKKLVDIIMPRLNKEKIAAVRVTGAENEDQRDAAMQAFQDPKSPVRVICITAAGSESINLQAAKALVFYDTPWSAGDFLQILGRMIRIGSAHDRCYAIHLVARGSRKKTVDHRVMDVLDKKMDLVEAVLGKRLKGEGDSTMIRVDNDISDIFTSLRHDALDSK